MSSSCAFVSAACVFRAVAAWILHVVRTTGENLPTRLPIFFEFVVSSPDVREETYDRRRGKEEEVCFVSLFSNIKYIVRQRYLRHGYMKPLLTPPAYAIPNLFLFFFLFFLKVIDNAIHNRRLLLLPLMPSASLGPPRPRLPRPPAGLSSRPASLLLTRTSSRGRVRTLGISTMTSSGTTISRKCARR